MTEYNEYLEAMKYHLKNIVNFRDILENISLKNMDEILGVSLNHALDLYYYAKKYWLLTEGAQ